ncbi:MAG: hypothetical protein LH630_05835 [Actinomycetia bacterium]|nr:hypothetical protein [Actinomycetes bacterium]
MTRPFRLLTSIIGLFLALVGIVFGAIAPTIAASSPKPTATTYTYDLAASVAHGTMTGLWLTGMLTGPNRERSPSVEVAPLRLGDFGVAAETGGGETVQLFRSVDAAEFDSIASTGRFSTAPGHMEGKFFATSGEHAAQWGQLLHGGDALTVETRIPKSLADQLFLRQGKLDGVGPAVYANGGQLDLINQLMDGIRAWS